MALAVDEPWWWAVLALGAETINVHFDCQHRGPLAIVSRGQKPWHRRRDIEAIEAILRGQGRPTFDAYRCPHAEGKIVGLVEVVDCVDSDHGEGLWFVGPYGLKVEKQCLVPIGASGSLAPAPGLLLVNSAKRDAILYALTAMANRHLDPGAQHR